MSRLLHISDPHFGTEQAPVVEALVSFCRQASPDLVVLSGDITQRAQPEEFRAARAFVDRLGCPVLAIPGNHDIPLFDLAARAFRPYGRYGVEFGQDLEPQHASDELLVFGVRTTRRYRHANGEVSGAQVDRVAAGLQRATAAQLRIIVVHQPVAVQRPQDAHDLLRGHRLATRAWSAAGGDLVLGGHIHLPYVAELPGLPRRMWAVQAGTAVSSRVRAGTANSVNLIRSHVDGDARPRVTVEQWNYVAAPKSFVCGATTALNPDRSGG